MRFICILVNPFQRHVFVYLLSRFTVYPCKRSAQRFVTGDDRANRLLQPIRVHLPYQFHDARHVVARALWLQLMQHIQPPLRRRQRIRCLWLCRLNPAVVARIHAAHIFRQRLYRRSSEQLPQRQLHRQLLMNARHQRHSLQRMTTALEE
ncbi:hypothetical protein D3C76_1016200 [compost metagenome]